MKTISNQTAFAEKLAIPPSQLKRLISKAPEGILVGGIVAAIVFYTTSLSPLMILGIPTITIFAPVFIPAIIALILTGASVVAILTFLENIGIPTGNKKIIPMSFETRLDELGAFVWSLVIVPSIAVGLTGKRISAKKKKIIIETLEQWGYSRKWIDSKLDVVLNNKSAATLITSKVLWNTYKSYFNNPKNMDKKSKSIKKDLPDPDFLKVKMMRLASDFLSGESPKKCEESIDKLKDF